jgi:hypothetical protein
MNRFAPILAVVFAAAVVNGVRAQTADFVGKVLDPDGKPVVGAEVSATNTAFPDRVQKGTTDKKGSFFVSGLLYTAQAPMWKIAVKADGFVPQSAKIVARDAQKTMYFSDDVKLSATKLSTEVRIRGYGEIRVELCEREYGPLQVVGGHPHVELDHVGARHDRRFERRDRVLGLMRGIATVRDDEPSALLTESSFRHYARPSSSP